MAQISVQIVNFRKYNPRKDLKHPRWFAMDNRWVENHEFFDLTSDEKIVWIYMLSLASQSNHETITVHTTHATTVLRVPESVLTTAIEKLIKIKCLKRSRTRSVRGLYASRTESVRDTTLQDTTVQNRGYIQQNHTPPNLGTLAPEKSAVQIREMIPILSYEKWCVKYTKPIADAEIQRAIDYYQAEPGHEFWNSMAWVRRINAWLARSKSMPRGDGKFTDSDLEYIFAEDKK